MNKKIKAKKNLFGFKKNSNTTQTAIMLVAIEFPRNKDFNMPLLWRGFRMKTTIKADSACYNHPGDKEISPELRTKTAEGADEDWGFVEQSKEEKTTIKSGRLWEAER